MVSNSTLKVDIIKSKLVLGGIAKGYTAQLVVDYLSEWGPCLVDGGGDLTAGAAPKDWPGWPVAIATPYRQEAGERNRLLIMWLMEGTMATSGIDYRRWLHNGRSAHTSSIPGLTSQQRQTC